jgi:sulfatase maturation enzyme AslB (radical SAM superfamily)
LDLLTTCIQHSEPRLITASLLICTIHRLPQHQLSLYPACCVLYSRTLATAFNSADSSAFGCRYRPANNSRLNCSASFLQNNSSAWTTKKTQPRHCCRRMSAAPLRSNGCGKDHIENTGLLLHACCGLYLATAAFYRVAALLMQLNHIP